MGRLTIFRRQASPGAMVTLRLIRGEDVTGRVTELDESHVCVDLGHRVVTIFEEILAGWEIHQTASDLPAHRLDTEAAAVDLSASVQPPAEAQSAPPVEVLSPVSDPAVLARRSRIDATYAEGIERARLAAPEPDFSFFDAEFPPAAVPDIRREWDRARNQYNYAMKVREESRLINIVGQVLRPLIERYPRSPSLHALTGGLLLKLGRRVEAVEHFRKAAHESRKSDHWYALAYATTATALECYALRNCLIGARAEESREVWLRYLALAIDHSDRFGVVRLLDYGFSQAAGSAAWEMAAETLIYLYGRAEQHSIADHAAVALVRRQAFPPEGWREVVGRILREPSAELSQEEERGAVRIERPGKLSSIPSGRIVSFGNQRFGFIDAEDGETYFFRLDDVADDGLKQALLDGHWRGRAKVEFTSLPSVGHQYQRAVEILPLQDVGALLNRARQLRQINQHAQAMGFVRRALSAEPDSRDAQMLEADIKEEIRVRGIGLPKDKGPYACAKRSQLVDQDLVSAERLFRLAIQQGDKPESATKDLVSLLQQQGRFDEAVALLESKRSSRRGVGPYDSMLATLYQQLGRHQDAMGLLTGLERVASPRTRFPILRRIAFSQFKSGSYDEAERTLRTLLAEAPGDRTAERWLAGLEEARRSGSYDDAAEIIGGLGALVEEGFELSPLARVAIDACAFEGVDPSRLQSGSLTDKDVDRLEDLAKQLGTRRPRDRAAYYLSAAAILSRRGSDEDAARIYDYLRRHFASMGDAAWVDKRPADVVRTYYIESLALVSDRQLDEAWRTLVRYLATFSSAGPENSEDLLPRATRRGRIPKSEYVVSLQNVLKSIRPTSTDMWRLGLLDASSQAGFVSQVILETIAGDSDVRASLALLVGVESGANVGEVASRWTAKCRDFARSRLATSAVFGTLMRHQLTAASMEDLLALLGRAGPELCDLDRRRIGDLSEIADSALSFCRATDFEEKEQHYWLVTTRAQVFIGQVRNDPTQFSHSALLAIAQHLKSLTEEEYAQVARTSAAQLELRLLVHDYVRLQRGEVKLQVEVANRQGCSPASSVRLILGPSDSQYFEASRMQQDVSPALRGGASVVAHVSLTLREAAQGEPAFPIRVRASYRNRVGEECYTEETEWTVRLYGESEFESIQNRYAPYAEGGPVDDPQMFVGRGDLLDRLESSLLSASGSKCVVVFGQKRAGKSSILEHLRRRLGTHMNCVPVQFSLYETGPDLDEAAFVSVYRPNAAFPLAFEPP